MEITNIKIIESLIVVVFYFLARIFAGKLIESTRESKLLHKPRAKIIKKAINLFLLFVCSTIILVIWGVKQADLAAYLGSILTVVGVAFFAQWSILSNITSSVIIFFTHAVKLDDNITIMEGKDYEIEGRVSNISLFFITLKTEENDEISLPNNIFIQKMIKKKKAKEKKVE